MSVRKRNDWLEADDADHSDNDSDGSVSEEMSKAQIKSRTIKRRRIDEEPEDSEDLSEDEGLDKSTRSKGSASELKIPVAEKAAVEDDRFGAFAEDEEDEQVDEASASRDLSRAEDEVQDDQDTLQAASKQKPKGKKKSGVVYLSRIPPFMKPQTLRSYLSPFGDIGKVFLTPEDHATYQRRKRSGGNKKKSYVDGWVEFLSKKDAKMVANVLNGNIIGGKKGNYYHDDIWNIKYLHGFKWDDLTEQIARENKEREARLRAEITKAKRENEDFVRDVERGKMLHTMQQRREDRGAEAGTEAKAKEAVKGAPQRTFKQNAVKDKKLGQTLADDPGGAASNVLSRIF